MEIYKTNKSNLLYIVFQSIMIGLAIGSIIDIYNPKEPNLIPMLIVILIAIMLIKSNWPRKITNIEDCVENKGSV